ncbi:MAG: FMN-binding negative transcriptional regulator [Sulfuricaulis sp.]
MYLPEHFQEIDQERLAALIERHAFGLLITAPGGIPYVSHIPFLYEKDSGAHGKLIGHLARANPQWQHLAQANQVLAVFQGPHAYVSPSWYGAPGVPTWNYAVAHLYGKPRLVEDEATLETIVRRLTQIHESRFPIPWQPDLTGERRSKLLSMIVGFEIAVTDRQGKFKLGQNRSPEDQQRVTRQLSQSQDPLAVEVAKLMQRNIKR